MKLTKELANKIDLPMQLPEEMDLYLGGSRYFNQRDNILVAIDPETTDYDLYGLFEPTTFNRLLAIGFEITVDENCPYLDDLASVVLARGKVQVVLRKNVELYSLVNERISPYFFYIHLWKSAPHQKDVDKNILKGTIGDIYNALFAQHEEEIL